MPAALVIVMRPTRPAATATTVVVGGVGGSSEWFATERDGQGVPAPARREVSRRRQPPGRCAVRTAAGRRLPVLVPTFGVTCRVYGQTHGYNYPPPYVGRGY